MGVQLLLIPALFVTICVTFIIIHSCYHKWKMSTVLKKKRDAAKISLVNILQMTNATIMSPAWSANGPVKSSIKPSILVSEDESSNNSHTRDETKKKCCHLKPPSSTFNPRNPNVLSSVLTLNDQPNLPPPCYEDLYGPGGAVFTFKSLSPDHEEPPPFPSKQQKENEGYNRNSNTVSETVPCSGQYQYSNCNNSCLLQVPRQDAMVPSQERRNSSAVLYL